MSTSINGPISWLERKVVDPLLQILRRGTEPKQLAFSAAVGLTLGIFPICGMFSLLCPSPSGPPYSFNLNSHLLLLSINTKSSLIATICTTISTSAVLSGVTVFLCGLAIALLGSHCHSPTVLLANFVATPIELSLVVPFLRLGEAICGGPHFSLTSDALKQVLTGQASHTLVLSVVHALLGWLVAAPFIMTLLYVILLPCFKLLVRKFSSVPSSSSPKMHIHPEMKLKVRDV